MEPRPSDEGRHRLGIGEAAWEESWDFDFHAIEGDLGGYLRLGLRPGQSVAWFWAALVGDGRPLVTVVDLELPLPRGPGLDLRAEGLWTSLTCETPMEHWSVGLEAFGVALDDPTEAYRGVRGDRTALGLDLEWETIGPVADHPHPEGYHLPCLVHGEVLVGAEVVAFDGWGGRSHAWGAHRWWEQAWCTTSGRLDDGTTWHGDVVGGTAPLGADGLARRGRTVTPGTGEVVIDPLHHAPVHVVGPDGRTSRLARSMCRYATPDGRRGTGWAEWNQPSASPSG
ncbi:MAG: hypothetical protein KY438_08490 [Actinobacteria bacterium]|nr:hypothetical protein [Actinomycetota bacterium]